MARSRWNFSELPHAAGNAQLKVAWAASDAYRGPLLVRLFRVDDRGLTAVGLSAPIGQASPTELRLDESTMTDSSWPPGWRLWGSTAEIPGPGCFVWQIEGETFSRTGYFEILPD